MNLKFIVAFVIAYYIIGAAAATSPIKTGKPLIKIVAPLTFKKVDAKVYLTAVPVGFNVSLPHRLLNNDTTKSGLVNHIFGHLLEDLDDFNGVSSSDNTTYPIHSRKERIWGYVAAGIGGLLLRPVLAKVFPSLFGGDSEARKRINDLRETIDNRDKNFVRFTESQLDYNQVTATSLNFAHKKINKIKEGVERLANRTEIEGYWQEEASVIHQSIQDCRYNHFPNRLITGSKLRIALHKLTVDLAKRGFELTIPAKDTNQYLKYGFTDCFFTTTHVFVVLNVPVKLKTTSWEVYELNYKQFAYNNQSCSLEPRDYNYYAVEKDKAVLIRNPEREHCHLAANPLCLLPQYTTHSSSELNCIIGLKNDRSVEHALKHCDFKCWESSSLNIDQDGDTLYVTNAKHVSSVCNGSETNYELHGVGSLEVKLVCDCTWQIDGIKMLPPLFCSKEQLTVYHNIANVMTNIKGGVKGNIFSDYDSIFNGNWTGEIHAFTNFTPQFTPLPPPMQEGFTWGYVTIWLLILSILILCIFFHQGCMQLMIRR